MHLLPVNSNVSNTKHHFFFQTDASKKFYQILKHIFNANDTALTAYWSVYVLVDKEMWLTENIFQSNKGIYLFVIKSKC